MGVHENASCAHAETLNGYRMTILLLMPLAEQRGGSEFALWHLLLEGRNQGIRWLVVFFEDGPIVALVRQLGIDVHVVETGRLRQPVRMSSSIIKIATIVRQEGVDAVFSWMGKANLYGSAAACIAGVPSGWFQHGMPQPRNWVDRLTTLLPASIVLACSDYVGEAQTQLWPHRPVRVVHPGVELDRFDPTKLPAPADCRQELGLPPHGPIIGLVGRLQRWKGFHVLIDAMPAILREHPNAHCLLVGGEHHLEAAYPNFLRSRISNLGLGDRVIITGMQQDVPRWMEAMDVVVHASDREPFGIVIIEAMALGKPVVAADSGGPTEIITNEVDGLLTPFGDAPALAAAVNRYLADPGFARHLGESARRRAQQFSSKAFAANVAGAIAELAMPKARYMAVHH